MQFMKRDGEIRPRSNQSSTYRARRLRVSPRSEATLGRGFFYHVRSRLTVKMLNCSRPFICGFLMSTAVALTSVAAAAPEIWPAVSSAVPKEPRIEARIADLLQHLTLEQKVAQMVQADIRYVTPEDVKKYRLGAVLNGGGAFPGDD